ncbi:hypothetical protein FBU30_010349 [Linnemannia zychae]|nr:hypothetical protein FBU30_010349 [Linnemannia zychae]
MIPVQQLLSPNEGTMNALSELSIEQLNSMEETLRRAKMNRSQITTPITSAAPSRPSVHSSSLSRPSTSNMRQFMSVMNTTPKKSLSPTKPLIKIIDGVQWLTFTYVTRSTISTPYTVRADIDHVKLEDIPQEFQQENCLYPSANGPEEEYKGSRRDYERECNEQGWKLAHLNPTTLSGYKGILQRAVISLRNASTEQKSRRVKRQEKRIQVNVLEKDIREPVLPISRLVGLHHSQVLSESQSSQSTAPTSIVWKPLMTSHLQESVRRPEPSDLIPAPESHSRYQTALSSSQKLPNLGLFEDSPLSWLEFDGYSQGQFKRIRLQVNITGINADDLPYDFKKNNCVYPRSFMTHSDQSEHWNTFGIRQAEESFLNEIGWKLCSANCALLSGKRVLLQQALDAYRRQFLPLTGQPRARIGPSLLTRRNSTSDSIFSLFNKSEPSRSTRRQSQQTRVQFDTRVSIAQETNAENVHKHHQQQKKGVDRDPARFNSAKQETESEESDGESDDFKNRGEEGSTSEEDDEDDDRNDSFEDESGEGSSSEDRFHSQMSLLSFTGSIRTYSLGTGSGSARSRPRIHSNAPSVTSRKVSSPLSRQSETIPTTTTTATVTSRIPVPTATTVSRKRSWAEYNPQSHADNIQGRSDKRVHFNDHREGKIDALENNHQSYEGRREPDGNEGKDESETGEDEDTSEDENGDEGDQGGFGEYEDEDEVDWWKSRLNNSEYAEDHVLVSMTTEELIGALTNCYNSDVEDYYDEED